MADPKGDHLFVNVGPSQARRRLKGFGHGVKKIQSAGRNRAVVVHTAMGRHLKELEAKFADLANGVIPAAQARKVMDLCWGIEKLANAAVVAKASAA